MDAVKSTEVHKKNSINISSLKTFGEETEGRKSRRDRRLAEKGGYYMKTEHLVQYNSMSIFYWFPVGQTIKNERAWLKYEL